MIDARQYVATESLPNGFDICIRAVRADDCDRIVDAFHKLDADSVYLRFFGPKKGLSEDELKRFRELDFTTRVVLIGTIEQDGQEVVIASGSYVRVDEHSAEVAFIIEEDYHRLGIARRLLAHLGTIAADAGIKTFAAEVLPHNKGMLGVFGCCGWPMTSKTEDGTVHITLELTNN